MEMLHSADGVVRDRMFETCPTCSRAGLERQAPDGQQRMSPYLCKHVYLVVSWVFWDTSEGDRETGLCMSRKAPGDAPSAMTDGLTSIRLHPPVVGGVTISIR
ncbi:24-hydroxycholesterol 7-alpha-hydroxylase precursor [Anopheles sinensis]|uniref:24-hydroxycholesterol 7-alpha-hydroxylase n=1 Tax=Anopheles sinensis TaxID=74873 RepID=A0A084WGN9_ANOSI|nr:24-hydroxycholesterol 7-alpha-hydroxylase precursor [Anopheles sinensis]